MNDEKPLENLYSLAKESVRGNQLKPILEQIFAMHILKDSHILSIFDITERKKSKTKPIQNSQSSMK